MFSSSLFQFLLGFSILVGLHEFGHFITARMFGIRVNKFYIFFDFLFPMPNVLNFALFKKKVGDTEYGLGWFPFGGYVQIDGMMDETQDASKLEDQPAQPHEFRSKPAWQRMIVMLGGIIVNVILGVTIFICINYFNGKDYVPIEEANKLGFSAQELGQKIGFQNGDKILKVNGQKVTELNEVLSTAVLLSENASYIIDRAGKEIELKIPADFAEQLITKKKRVGFIEPIRSSHSVDSVFQAVPRFSGLSGWVKTTFMGFDKDSIPPAAQAGLRKGDVIVGINKTPIKAYHEIRQTLQNYAGKDVSISVQRNGKIDTLKTVKATNDGSLGFYSKSPEFKSEHIDYSLGEAICIGTKEAFAVVTDNIKGLAKIFRGDVSASNAMSGPVGIAKMFGVDWTRFWVLVGMLSMILAFMNLLPIPVLDGGHVLFLIYEMITGKALPLKFQEVAMNIGTYLVLGLMLYSLANDLLKLG